MANNTAILLIDPYNDFLHPDGKITPGLQESLDKSGTIEALKILVSTAHKHKLPIFYCLHQQTDAYSYRGWHMMNWSNNTVKDKMVFEKGSWGAEIFEGLRPDYDNGDVIVSKHWNSSSFHNTDLDFQLRQRGISNVVIGGMVSNTCVEATARYAYELGYDITMLSDATAGFTTAQKDAGVELIWPLFAGKVVKAQEWVQSLQDAEL
ncbi:hypothetical protein G647_07372 [Cladophialophora carrionii CBS 160.54]|uniref:Isochorismatase-like domain-containing protein n=1 Tax=Cladophialophora carrionii CBS 160.54 TaxID=1279043 RepID=V9D279_9EURO|nr:uncharacterized protein G647_07372 [Cladophialophora carrionii CBS 160.54]ETI21029.1 hypothetical protein G647_07372 [Cladophialophora carrionii CBS 160.54]